MGWDVGRGHASIPKHASRLFQPLGVTLYQEKERVQISRRVVAT